MFHFYVILNVMSANCKLKTQHLLAHMKKKNLSVQADLPWIIMQFRMPAEPTRAFFVCLVC